MVHPLPPPSVSAPFVGYLKLRTATQIREKSEQMLESMRIELVTSSTEGSAVTNCATRLLSKFCTELQINKQIFNYR